jgi:L-methionine (R)-S-oxide reductase
MVEVEKIKKEVLNLFQKKYDREVLLFAISVLLKEEVYHYDWVGFYILNEEKSGLLLGPYSGASTIHSCIPVGKGICGQVAQNKNTMIVQDVSSIDNYLSCSINVQSEIVIPILKNGDFVAELDIDSHSSAPFTNDDLKLLEFICSQLSALF